MTPKKSETRTALLLRDARELQALTVQALAAKVARSPRTVIRWENGQALPDLDLIRPLAAELHISWRRLAEARHDDVHDRRRARLGLECA